jgi:hypothetical protein
LSQPLSYLFEHVINIVSPQSVEEERSVSISGDLTSFLTTLLHQIIGGDRHRRRPWPGMDHHERCRRRALNFNGHRPVSTHRSGGDVGAGSSTAQQPSASTHSRVLERPPSPSPDRPEYWPMEHTHADASPRAHWGHLCVVHSWRLCPNPVARTVVPSSLGHEGRRREKKKKNHWSA